MNKKVAKKPAPKKSAVKKPAAKKSAAKKSAAKLAAAPKKPAPRKDLGKSIDGWFTKQPAALRPIGQALRKLVEETVPEATSSIKWGMPFFSLGDTMMCAIGGHKSHVNLVLAGPPASFDDPDGRLTGEGKTGRHLKVRTLDELPAAKVRGWIATAAANARGK